MFLRAVFIVSLSIYTGAYAQRSDTIFLTTEATPSEIEVTTLKAYLGKFEFAYRDAETLRFDDYILVDWVNEPYIKIEDVEVQNLSSISFLVGVDSAQILNGAMQGDLDPGNGMFWTWQSGYINFKCEYLEAGSQHDYHIGGYKRNQNTAMRLTIDIPPKKQLSGIAFQTNAFIEFVKRNDMSSVMSPGKSAVSIAEHFDQFIIPVWYEADR